MTLVAAGVAAVTLAVVAGAAAWLKYNSYAEQTARATKIAQEALDKTKADLDSAQSNLDDTDSKIADLAKQIQDINDKGTLTLADKAQRSELQAQLDNLREIKKTQEEIIKLKNKQLLSDQQAVIHVQYGNDKSADEWGSNLKGISSRLYDTESASINQLIANINYLNKSKQDLTITDESYNSQMKEQTTALNEQKVGVLQQIETLTELGDTSSDEYKELQKLYEEITLVLDPSSYPELALDNLISSAGLSDKIKDAFEKGGEEGSEAIKKYAGIAAQKIANNSELKANFAKAFNLNVNDLGIDTLTEQILILFQRMFQGIQDSAQSMTANEVFSEYLTTVDSLTEQQTLLNKALGEMQYNGELTSDTVQKLIEKYPELSNRIEIQNGKLVLESKYLNETWEAQKQATKDKVASQIEETKNTVEAVKTRIAAYMGEAEALQALANSGQDTSKIEALQDAANNGDVKAARQLGAIITEQQRKQQKAEAGLARLQQIYNNMNMGNPTPTKPSGTSTKKSGSGSGSKKDPEKEAYELKKSEIEVVQKQLELEKSKLEQQKKGLEQQKSALELDKSQIESQKQIKEQQLDIIEDAEDGIDDIIDLIKKMTKQDYENLKTKLGEVKDYIGDFKDALDDVKDTYDDLVDDAKDKLKAEKEAADNQKKLEDGAKSIAEIQAQLAEIQYDDSADAQAKRLELTASLNEKQQDLEDEMKDQAYDAATDALDKTKDKVDNIFDAIGDILDASQDAIADYITYISDELESEGNLYQAAVAQFNDTSEGAQEELYNRLIEYNNKYGDSINKTVTEPWNEAIAAVEKYKEVAGSANIDTVRQYLGTRDTQLNASIKLDEQTIDGLDNQIDQIKMDMDKVDQQVTQFEQAISQVKDALSQLEINYNATANASDAGAQGAAGTGNDYAYGLIKGLLQQAGVDTSTLPATYQGFVDALRQTTEAATGTSEALDNLTDKTEDTTPEVEDLGNKSEDTGNQTGETVEPLKDLADSGEQAAGALSGVANAASGSSSGSGFGNLLTFLTGGDTDKFVQNFATNAIRKYLPKLIKAGVSMIGKLHDGTDEVKKSNSWLDKMLGLGQDETARILKVGEAVIPDYANDAVQNMDGSSIHPTVTTPNTSNIKTTNNSELNIDMGDLDISGIDTTELRNELANIKRESANQVYSTLYRYIKVGGYRNVRSRYN